MCGLPRASVIASYPDSTTRKHSPRPTIQPGIEALSFTIYSNMMGVRFPRTSMDKGQDMGQDRVTLQEAARRLGVTEGAVRKRVQRDSIEHEKGEDGRVYVYLDTGEDTSSTESQDAGGTLEEELRDRVRFLERALETEQEGRRRADTIIAQLSQATAEQARTIRELEAPEATRDEQSAGQEKPDPGPERYDTQKAAEADIEPPLGWLRRIFWRGKP